MIKNKFRIQREEIKHFFIKDFASKGLDISHYVKVSLPYEWYKSEKFTTLDKLNESDYEEMLINFLKGTKVSNSKHPLLIIVGGAGTGKSASIRYAIAKSNLCDNCCSLDTCHKIIPSKILIDYLDFKSEISPDIPIYKNKKQKRIKENKFWHYLIKTFDSIIDKNLTPDIEIGKFWEWLLFKSNAKFVDVYYKILFTKSHLFSESGKNSNTLYELRDNFYKEISKEQWAYYRLAQLAFIENRKDENCNYLIFDNIDTLDPYLQTKLIDFAIESHRLIKTKAIIPMRPHTFELNKDASDFLEVISHWTPNIKDVIYKRLELFEKNFGGELSLLLKILITEIYNDKNNLEIIKATTANSVRFALKNITNFLLSPLIITHRNGSVVGEFKLDSNIFGQAYFSSETDDLKLYEKSFTNVFSRKKGPNISVLSTLKIRMLHFINRYGEIQSDDFINHLECFGYEIYDIIIALNEFLDKRKPLFWSSSLTEYNINSIYKGRKHKLIITPLGENYYNILLSKFIYYRECIVQIEKNRLVGLDNDLSAIFRLISTLKEQDMNEIELFTSNSSIKEYLEVYDDNTVCLSFFLWNKIKPSLKSLSNYSSNVIVDLEYENKILDDLKKVLIKD